MADNMCTCFRYCAAPTRSYGLSRAHGSCSRHRRPERQRFKAHASTDTEEKQRRDEAPDLSDPAGIVAWGGRLPSTRRAVVGGLSGLGIVLASNFAGGTSALLGLDGGRLAAKLHIDVLYSVAGFKRCYDPRNGFEFVYPGNWLADQSIARRNAARIERSAGLDPSSVRRRRRTVAEPLAAFGPAGSTGEQNVSVIVAPGPPGFRLDSLGSPQEAAEKFLGSTVAPPGSGLEARLLSASQRRDEGGVQYFSQEFTVRGPKFYRHNLSCYGFSNGQLYTLNAQTPETGWPAVASAFRAAEASFRILPVRADVPGVPGRL